MMGYSDHPRSVFQPPPELKVDERQVFVEEMQAQAIVR
jgi:hypothetical protein